MTTTTVTTATLSFAPEVVADSSGQFAGNSLRFATEAEAAEWVANLERRWMLVTATRVVPSADPVNYALVNGNLVTVTS